MKLSTHMDHISEHINSLNQKFHSYDQTTKTIFNLDSKERKNTHANLTINIIFY